jgi:hypothetical protein
MPIVRTHDPRLCRTCGTDISLHARYTRWTECSACYWKRRYESCESIPDLQRKRTEIQQRLAILDTEVPKAKKTLDEYSLRLHVVTPWFKRLFGPPTDSTLKAYEEQYQALYWEQSSLRSKLDHIPIAIERTRSTKKRFSEAQLARAAVDRRQKLQHQEQAEFADRSAGSLASPFERTHFHIQAKDYRRGNAIDNYCRNILEDAILTAFDHCCTFCGCDHDLAFDHYGLTKNEGGNFILLSSDKQSLRINLVVLCRVCNSMKAQRLHHHFFTEDQQQAILAHQQRFLSTVLSDAHFMKLIHKWGR